jgi:hypothetical protein
MLFWKMLAINKENMMNFGVYIDDKTGAEMNRLSELLGKTRNTIIREALSLWMRQNQPKAWPDSVAKFTGVSDFEPFESTRDELIEPKDFS